MTDPFIAKAAITIDASPAEVWNALTQPELIKRYLFETTVTTDWKVGSPIAYEGVWEGKAYTDKGKILEVEPERLIVSTYWSSLSGLADVPENYQTVRYELAAEGNRTQLTVIQDNNATQTDADHSAQNWGMVLNGMKQLLEG